MCSFSRNIFSSAGVSCQAARIKGGAGCQLAPALLRFGNISQKAFHCGGIGQTLPFSRQYRTKSSFICVRSCPVSKIIHYPENTLSIYRMISSPEHNLIDPEPL